MLAFLALVVLCGRFAAARGQGTDLYPRWYGLRELLLHGRDPYGEDISREVAVVQTWFFGKDDLLAGAGLPPIAPGSQASVLETVFGFLYPLPGVLLIAPLAILPYSLALPLWTLLVLLALPVAAWLVVDANASTTRSGQSDAHPPRLMAAKLLAPALALLFLPAWANLLIAQLVPAAAVLLATALWLSARARRPLLAGAIVAAAVALKPHVAGPVALMWLAWQGWRAMEGAAERAAAVRFGVGFGAGALFLLGPAFLLLPRWPIEFWRASRLYYQVAPAKPALWNAAGALLPSGLAQVVAGLAALLAIGWAAAGWRQRRGGSPGIGGLAAPPEVEGVCRGLIATALVVPPAWETNAIILLLPLAAALARRTVAPRAWRFAVAAVAISLLDFPLFLTLGWNNGTVLVLAYAALLVWWR